MATKDISDEQVILAYIEYSKNRGNKYPYDYLMEWTEECEKVCFLAIERSEERGYIDCGVSLRTGWITDEGKELINKKNAVQ